MIRLRYKIISVLLILGGVFLWGKCSKIKPVIPNVLPPNTVEQILVNPVNHTLTVVTHTGTQVVTLPDHVSTIDLGTNGKLTVKAPQFGFQIRPFAGVYYSDALRFGGGADLGYWKKLDLGVGIAGGASAHTVAFAQLTYNVWDNVGASLTYDHTGHIGGGITVRL